MATEIHQELKSWRALNDAIRECTDERHLRQLLKFELSHGRRRGFARRLAGRINAVRGRALVGDSLNHCQARGTKSD